MVVSDLDGTLINSGHHIPEANVAAMQLLGAKGITRVAATGRSPYSVHQVLAADFPLDYCIFSSGAGIMRWRDKRVLHAQELDGYTTSNLCKLLITNGVDFMLQDEIPHNHHFSYHRSGASNPDFERRLAIYSAFSRPLRETSPGRATQVVAVMSGGMQQFRNISQRLKGVKIIRSTSPLDGQTVWMELFAEGVSKGSGIAWLCEHLGGINPKQVVVVGNDYNDLDMLEYTPHSYVVANAPSDLRHQFRTIPSNDQAGFAHLINQIDRDNELIFSEL